MYFWIRTEPAELAQLVERSPRMRSVVGSIPLRADFSLKKEKAVMGVYLCLAFVMYMYVCMYMYMYITQGKAKEKETSNFREINSKLSLFETAGIIKPPEMLESKLVQTFWRRS